MRISDWSSDVCFFRSIFHQHRVAGRDRDVAPGGACAVDGDIEVPDQSFDRKIRPLLVAAPRQIADALGADRGRSLRFVEPDRATLDHALVDDMAPTPLREIAHLDGKQAEPRWGE